MGASRQEGAAAHICMTVIGIGYLFPIAAIWAAFDYWRELFPTGNIEFNVTSVYQVGSVATVAALSLSPSVSLRPRILGGFGGQFACLLAILAFRWVHAPRAVLYNLLLASVLFCSIATGYLDSALFSLCSQYSSKMQSYLQIGIGFGTLVSVIYRDSTKLFMAGDVADSTSIYFVVALATVAVCVGCYELLMVLPVSTGICDGAPLLGNRNGRSPRGKSPVPVLYTPTRNVTPSSSGPITPSEVPGDAVAGEPIEKAAGADFATVWRLVRWNEFTIFANFVLTTLCYPGMITSIPCRQLTFLKAESWFQTVLLTVFSLVDIVARFFTHKRFGLHHGNIHITLLIRSVLFPLILYCIVNDRATDLQAFLFVGAFGCLNGYCASLSLIVVNEIPDMSDEQRKTAGRISACAVNCGLCAGSLLAAGIATALDLSP